MSPVAAFPRGDESRPMRDGTSREVSLNMAPSPFRRRTLGLLVSALVLVATPARAQEAGDAGVPEDAPSIIHRLDGNYLFNPPAYTLLDRELKRLQAVEAAHKAEPSWSIPVLLGMGVGLTVGLVVGLVLWLAVPPPSWK